MSNPRALREEPDEADPQDDAVDSASPPEDRPETTAENDFETRLSESDAFDLVTELAHDIRSPLNSILFLSEVLRSGRSGPVSEHQRSQLGLIYSASLGIISVVNDIMELASARADREEEAPSAFSMARVFDSVDQMVRPMAQEKGLSLDFTLPDHDEWSGFPGKIGRVVLNLTTNALKYTDDGRVAVEARRIGTGRVLFSISDTGRGMTEEDHALMYQPFRKAANRSGQLFSASGLGLSIARRLVASMDSTLEVHTERGRGTRFDFTLAMTPLERT